MKRKLLLTSLIVLCSISMANAGCDGGTMVSTQSGSFCRSDKTMNWWSAHNWCRANGMSLVSMYDVCPDWDGNTGNAKCPQLSVNGSEYIWTSTAAKTTYAFAVSLSNGTVDALGGRHLNNDVRHAFCK